MNKAPSRILELLYDRAEGFVTLGELASAAQVAAGRVEAALEDLRTRGFQVESSPQGVRLTRPVPLDAYLIERSLGTHRVGRNAICFPEVGSTNDVAFDAAGQDCADGLVVLAEHQRAGRGRQGRTWISPPGTNILMSVLLVDGSLSHEPVTIAAGLAVAEGVEAACGTPGTLTWPNDVHLDGRKLSGVLVEVRRRASRRCVVIGIGINVGASPPAGRVDRPAIDLATHLGAPVERTEVVRSVLRRLDHWIQQVSSGQSEAALAGLHDAWMARCDMLNHRVAVLCGGRRYDGRVLDVSPLRGLALRDDHGGIVHLPAESSSVLP